MRDRSAVRSELVPSLEGLRILEAYFGSDRIEKLMVLVRSGSHNFNPYHNTLHELQHVYWSMACFGNATEDVPKGDPEVNALLIASLFHDHNHSGGRLTDDLNVERARAFVQIELDGNAQTDALIAVTQFVDGKFPVEPTNLAEQCMRDADLMSIYSREGQNLLLGLFEEMSGREFGTFTDSEVEDAVNKTETFLKAQTMYTEHGRRMFQDHFPNAMERFRKFAKDRRKFYPYED